MAVDYGPLRFSQAIFVQDNVVLRIGPEFRTSPFETFPVFGELVEKTSLLITGTANPELASIVSITTKFNRLLNEVVDYMHQHARPELYHQAIPYLRALNEKTALYQDTNLPTFSASIPDDRTLLVEWNFDHFAIGFSFSLDPHESSWYMVHDGTVRKMTAWAYLSSQTIPELVDMIISQVT